MIASVWSGAGFAAEVSDFAFSGALLFGSGAGGSELLTAPALVSGSPSLVKP